MSKEKLKREKQNRTSHFAPYTSQKGITLIALVITIIVMLILVGVTLTIALNGGLFPQAKEATDEYGNAQNIEQIKAAYMMAKGKAEIENKTNREMFEEIKNNLSLVGATYEIASQSMTITTKEGKTYTLLADGEVIEGKFAYLDIADGSVDIKSNGYIQGSLVKKNSGAYSVTGELVEYTGEYIITGTSSENVVKITEQGTYDITIKNLNIDVSTFGELCAFNANRNGYPTGVYVNLTIEGNNSLYGGNGAACLGFGGATPNIDGVTNGSTLTIGGTGKLYCQGKGYAAGIGTGYSGWDAAGGDANNIIINSGYIETKGGPHGSGIGAALYHNANNIVINGGEIHAYGKLYASGIGAPETASNIIINDGKIYAYADWRVAIGGATIKNLQINGGEVYCFKNTNSGTSIGCIGVNGDIYINGGTLNCTATKSGWYGIYSGEGSINITGGSIKIKSTEGYITSSVPISESGDLYLTQIQLQNVTDKTEITSLTTSDNINYGIKDMYTTKDDESTSSANEGGMLYLYLPLGSRTITVEAGGQKYSGTAETTETNTVVVLNKQ